MAWVCCADHQYAKELESPTRQVRQPEDPGSRGWKVVLRQLECRALPLRPQQGRRLRSVARLAAKLLGVGPAAKCLGRLLRAGLGLGFAWNYPQEVVEQEVAAVAHSTYRLKRLASCPPSWWVDVAPRLPSQPPRSLARRDVFDHPLRRLVSWATPLESLLCRPTHHGASHRLQLNAAVTGLVPRSYHARQHHQESALRSAWRPEACRSPCCQRLMRRVQRLPRQP